MDSPFAMPLRRQNRVRGVAHLTTSCTGYPAIYNKPDFIKRILLLPYNIHGTDIAVEFASWLSPEFKLYIIKDYHRLKADENSWLSLGWNLNRTLSKINCRIHTDAIKDELIPPDVTPQRQSITYASEADVLNVALFGTTTKEWRQANPDAKGNIRDDASLQQLIVLSNMESLNAEFIRLGMPQKERLLRLNESAKQMMKSLLGNAGIERLKELGSPME